MVVQCCFSLVGKKNFFPLIFLTSHSSHVEDISTYNEGLHGCFAVEIQQKKHLLDLIRSREIDKSKKTEHYSMLKNEKLRLHIISIIVHFDPEEFFCGYIIEIVSLELASARSDIFFLRNSTSSCYYKTLIEPEAGFVLYCVVREKKTGAKI